MQKRRLGRTNLVVGEIGVGCWPIGGSTLNLGMSAGWDGINGKDATEGLLKAIEMGANLFDTADVYGLGQSERLIGNMIEKVVHEELIRREDVVIATKGGYFQGCAPHGFDPLHMRHQLEMSLQNLKTDYIDVYFYHHLDFGPNDKYLMSAIKQMETFRDEGLIKHIGLRGPHKFSLYRKMEPDSFDGGQDRFHNLAELINPDVIGIRHNMISPTYDNPEHDIFKWAEEKDIGILIYKPLGQGLLLDKYDPNNPPKFSPGDHRNRKPWFKDKGLSVLKSRLAIIKEKFDCKNTSDLVQLAIKYCLSRSQTACVLVGFRNADQVQESLLTEGYLSHEEYQYIREAFQGINEEIGKFH